MWLSVRRFSAQCVIIAADCKIFLLFLCDFAYFEVLARVVKGDKGLLKEINGD